MLTLCQCWRTTRASLHVAAWLRSWLEWTVSGTFCSFHHSLYIHSACCWRRVSQIAGRWCLLVLFWWSDFVHISNIASTTSAGQQLLTVMIRHSMIQLFNIYVKTFLQCFDTVSWRQEWHPACNKVGVDFWWWRFDWSFARLIAPVVTTTSIILSCSNIQNEDILLLTYPGFPGKWPLDGVSSCHQNWNTWHSLQHGVRTEN